MEERREKDFTELIRERFSLPEGDYSQYSPLTLAYIGDNIYELVNRSVAVKTANKAVRKLHRECAARANASAQAGAARYLEPFLTEEEEAVFRRGRNAEVYTKAKNASFADYHMATGLEALIGMLYLKKEYDRLLTLLFDAWKELGMI